MSEIDVTDKEIVDWLSKVYLEEHPCLYILNNFYDAVEQYVNNPNSLVTKNILLIAMICTNRYLKDNNK